METKTKILLGILMALVVTSITYGLNSNYFLSGDLPLLLASVDSFGAENGSTNPYFSEGGPDIHNAYYLFSIFVLKTSSILTLDSQNVSFTSEVLETLDLMWVFGIIIGMLLVLNFFLLSKEILGSKIGAIASTIGLFFLVEIPLIRWAGILSFPGLMVNSYYPQTFALTIFFLSLLFFLKGMRNILFHYLSCFLFVLVFLSHLFTGIILFYLLLFSASLYYFNTKNLNYLKFAVALISAFTLCHVWPFFSIYSFLSLVVPYYLIILFIPLTIGAGFLFSFIDRRISQINFYNIRPKLESLAFFASFIGIAATLIVFNKFSSREIGYYLYLTNVGTWYLSFIYLIVLGISIIPLIFIGKNQPLKVISLCMLGSLTIYFAGASDILSLKIFWRFLFIAKIFGAILLGYFIIVCREKKKIFPIALFILIVVISSSFAIQTISESRTANYFKEVPPIFSIQTKINSLINNSVVLSDPETSYHIASLTNNKVVAVTLSKVSDYDRPLAQRRLEIAYELWKNAKCAELASHNIGGVVLNNHYLFESDLTSIAISRKVDYSEKKRMFEECGFYLSYEDENFVILVSKNYGAPN